MSKEGNLSDNLKKFFKKKYYKFSYWFTDKEHPRSRLNKNVFFYDLLKIIGFLLVYLIVHANVDKLNFVEIPIIKIGSLVLLILLFFILRKAWNLILNLKYAIRGWNNGLKAISAILIVLLLLLAFVNQEKVVNNISMRYDETNFSKLNPVQLNSTSIDFSNIFAKVNSCPQINVPMQNGKIPVQTYKEWNIYEYPCDALSSFFGCSIDCYKGSYEGQNKNYYYCGDKQDFIGKQLATLDKTPISDDGTIGKRIRKTFVNIYDSNGIFLKTICGADPEKITEQEWKDMRRELENLFGGF